MLTTPSPWQGRHGPLLIAEIGGNHEGDFATALRLLDLAACSGVDFVKFQIYTGDGLVSPVEAPDRHRHFRGFELSREQHVELVHRCDAAGVGYLASVWDLGLLQWIDPQLTMYKVGSGDLTALPLLRWMATRGKPMILSTGLATLNEVLAATHFVQGVNPAYRRAEQFALLQCTSSYPTPLVEANLRAMDDLRAASGLAVGYSDHTVGDLALLVAAARGAQILEFHFTDKREGRTFRDHAVSLTADEVRELCLRLDALRLLLGDGVKAPQPGEIDSDHVRTFRRAVYCRRDIAAGEVLTADDLVCLRPNHGIDAREFDRLPGRRARVSIKAFRALMPTDFADNDSCA